MQIDLLAAVKDRLKADKEHSDKKTDGYQLCPVPGAADHGNAVEHHREELKIAQRSNCEIHEGQTAAEAAVLKSRVITDEKFPSES